MAKISKSTFYLHYPNIDQIFQSVAQSFVVTFSTVVKKISTVDNPNIAFFIQSLLININESNRLITIALPRVRDFRGISKNSFDGRGNYTLGIKEQLVFPEVEYDQVIKVRGLDIVIVTTAKTNEEALALLTEFGLPFRK